jgi:hypothetical protein
MQFNEFVRRLDKCQLDHDSKYILSHMFEVQMEFSKHLDMTLALMESLADKLHKSTLINKGMMDEIKKLQRHGIMDGVSVRSENVDD